MKDKRLKKIAQQIVELENKCRDNKNNDVFLLKMQQLVQNLSVTELLQIDEYIQENKLLTK